MVLRTLFMTIAALLVAASSYSQPTATEGETVLVIHGGAGTILRENMSPEMELQYREKLAEALRAGHAILASGGTSLDAVETAIHVMEDSPLFNAGKGSVFAHDGRNEMDASIMDGSNRMAGAVTSVTIIRHPISAARAVMEKSEHVLLSGRGAELFATTQGLEIVAPEWFWTERRWKQLQDALRAEQHPAAAANLAPDAEAVVDRKFGTVGAVALDRQGNLAAGTSTGGRTNKRWNRVGDSPIIGAGTWADNQTCAVSGTGHGEFFMRWVVGYDIAALMEYRGLSVKEASELVINGKLKEAGGEAGVIALDSRGNFAMPFNSAGMYRGYVRSDGIPRVAIYGEDEKPATPPAQQGP
ncbi:MAG: isoaspartyl peptidase/L-asparaginase [Acidobacteria bacterium]|nr:isoaspartyl peptidase/L-asparaginase [Acidobacteriota bacterium]